MAELMEKMKKAFPHYAHFWAGELDATLNDTFETGFWAAAFSSWTEYGGGRRTEAVGCAGYPPADPAAGYVFQARQTFSVQKSCCKP